ncbi:hypothetical protein ABEB36_003077 [Hypothenemus hampei]|uniref:Uncharacterized protein n=1 Tax=Hypothenemus hampei TaxID=57062 RepID=A0ABD1FBM0_HYPHA
MKAFYKNIQINKNKNISQDRGRCSQVHQEKLHRQQLELIPNSSRDYMRRQSRKIFTVSTAHFDPVIHVVINYKPSQDGYMYMEKSKASLAVTGKAKSKVDVQ